MLGYYWSGASVRDVSRACISTMLLDLPVTVMPPLHRIAHQHSSSSSSPSQGLTTNRRAHVCAPSASFPVSAPGLCMMCCIKPWNARSRAPPNKCPTSAEKSHVLGSCAGVGVEPAVDRSPCNPKPYIPSCLQHSMLVSEQGPVS